MNDTLRELIDQTQRTTRTVNDCLDRLDVSLRRAQAELAARRLLAPEHRVYQAHPDGRVEQA